jgi:hypothetical protein
MQKVQNESAESAERKCRKCRTKVQKVQKVQNEVLHAVPLLYSLQCPPGADAARPLLERHHEYIT